MMLGYYLTNIINYNLHSAGEILVYSIPATSRLKILALWYQF